MKCVRRSGSDRPEFSQVSTSRPRGWSGRSCAGLAEGEIYRRLSWTVQEGRTDVLQRSTRTLFEISETRLVLRPQILHRPRDLGLEFLGSMERPVGIAQQRSCEKYGISLLVG